MDEDRSYDAAGDDFEEVTTLSELKAATMHRLVVRIPSNNRAVVVFLLDDGSVSALDEYCYHHGGPLSDGDIEELPGGRCVVLCPWHQYKIDVKSGDCLYVGIDPATGTTTWKSKGVKQRPHTVQVREDGTVWVRDSSATPRIAAAGITSTAAAAAIPRIESDTYAFMTVAPQPRDRIMPRGPKKRAGLASGLEEQDATFGEMPLHSSFLPSAAPWARR